MTKKKKRIPLSIKILIGLVAGTFAGFLFLSLHADMFVRHWIVPFGDIFLNLLKLIAVPVVFLSVVCGIFGIGNIQDFSKLAFRTFGLYIITTLCAILLGLFLVSIIRPGEFGNALPEKTTTIVQDAKPAADKGMDEQSQVLKDEGPLKIIADIVPDNIVKSLSDNGKMLQIIFVAIFLGLVILSLPESKTNAVRDILEQGNTIFIKGVDFIMRFAPVGVFALMSGMVVEFGGDIGVIKALGVYALTVILGLVLIMFLFYPLLIGFFTDIRIKTFLRAIYPAQLVAFTTSSSAATLPVTKRQVEQELHISEKITGFILPLGMTINMDGTSLYQVVAVVFISQLFGIDLSVSQLLLIILLSLLSSIGTPGIPGGSIVMLMFILSSVGIPAEGLALILGIDRPLDMLRTSTNITGDAVICCLQRNTLT